MPLCPCLLVLVHEPVMVNSTCIMVALPVVYSSLLLTFNHNRQAVCRIGVRVNSVTGKDSILQVQVLLSIIKGVSTAEGGRGHVTVVQQNSNRLMPYYSVALRSIFSISGPFICWVYTSYTQLHALSRLWRSIRLWYYTGTGIYS